MSKLLEQPGNFKIVENLLLTTSDKFLELRGKRSRDEVIQQYEDMVKDVRPEYFDSVDLWQSLSHMKLKQLTQTRYLQQFDALPEMLKVQVCEVMELSANNNLLNYIFTFLTNNFVTELGVLTPVRFKEIFSTLSINIKKNSLEFGSEWFNYTDIENFVGYNLDNPLTTEGKETVVDGWAKGKMSRGEDFRLYYKQMYEILVKRFTDGLSVDSLTNLSLKDYIQLIQPWMTDGSSRGERLEILVDGKTLKSNGKKQVLALKYSGEVLASRVLKFNKFRETYSVSEKIEPGLKKRCIISAPFEQQIRLGYVEYCVGSLFKHAFPDVFFLQSQSRQLGIQDELCELSKNRGRSLVFFPLDASSFDQFVSKEEISSVFLALREVLSRHKDKLHDEVFTMLDLGLHAWFNTDIVINKVKNVGIWEHGVPSGVRWTTLMDSIINAVRFDVCKRQIGSSMLVERTIFQGDDMMIALRRLSDTIKILDFYSSHNIPIHPRKNFLSYDYFEFLRKIYQNGTQLAYPNRTITKFCFRLPENSGAIDNRALLQERFNSVFRICGRYNSKVIIIPKITKIAVKLFPNLDKYTALELIVSPTVLGGLGYIPSANRFSNKIKRTLTNFTYSTVTQPKIVLPVTGLYSTLAKTFGIKPTLLANSLEQSLNPTPAKNFKQTVRLDSFKYNPLLAINLKLNLSKGIPGKWRPWMPTNEYLTPMLPDVISDAIEHGDYPFLRSITNIRVIPTFDLFLKRMEPKLFNSWINSSIDTPTFSHTGLNDMQRKHLCDLVYGNYLLRYLTIHDSMTIVDNRNLVLLSYFYIANMIDYVLTKNIMYPMLD